MYRTLAICLILIPAIMAAQQPASPAANTTSPGAAPGLAPSTEASGANTITVPAGTKIPIVLKHALSTRNARENDNVYAETNFPIVVNGKVAIPPGTYVQGVVNRVRRPGRVSGKGELLIHFNSLIFPNGYTLLLPGAIDNVPGAEASKMKGSEGTVQGPGSGGKDAGTIIGSAGTGAAIGAIASQSGSGAGIGAGAGGAVGLARVLLTRGPDLRLAKGTTIEMVLERAITIDRGRTPRK